MQLFYAPNAIALVSLIMLEELGVPYIATRLNLAGGEQRQPDYLAVNPKGRVPALVTDQGTLTETPAILTYLAAIHPEARLMPADPFQAARVQEVMAYLCSTVHVSHAHKTRGYRWSDDQGVIDGMKVNVTRNMAGHYAYLEARFVGPWVFGGYTVADPYLYVLCSWAGSDGVDLTAYPKLSAHQAAMSARPAVQRALAKQS